MKYWLGYNHVYLKNMSQLVCFIKFHLYSGCLLSTTPGLVCVLQVTGTERRPWLGGPGANGSSSKDTVQLIASQMILPKDAGLGGCTVVSYYRVLLQKATEYELGSADPSKTSRPPARTLLLFPRQSPASSFNNATLSTSGLLSQSLQR